VFFFLLIVESDLELLDLVTVLGPRKNSGDAPETLGCTNQYATSWLV
jgi:hypothetical protein